MSGGGRFGQVLPPSLARLHGETMADTKEMNEQIKATEAEMLECVREIEALRAKRLALQQQRSALKDELASLERGSLGPTDRFLAAQRQQAQAETVRRKQIDELLARQGLQTSDVIPKVNPIDAKAAKRKR